MPTDQRDRERAAKFLCDDGWWAPTQRWIDTGERSAYLLDGLPPLADAFAAVRAEAVNSDPFACPTCGPEAKCDEDGCCATCGADIPGATNPPAWLVRYGDAVREEARREALEEAAGLVFGGDYGVPERACGLADLPHGHTTTCDAKIAARIRALAARTK